MANILYITAVEAVSGKITLVLGVMEMLTRRIRTIGYFRPVILSSDPPDNDIQLILSRYNPTLSSADTYGCTLDQARKMSARGQYNEFLETIISKYKRLQSQCRFVLCEGTDYSGTSSPLEFDFNADAANLGAPVMIVINGQGKSPARLTEMVRKPGPT